MNHYNNIVTDKLFKEYRGLLLSYADDNKDKWDTA